MVLAVATAGAIGLIPAAFVATPAFAVGVGNQVVTNNGPVVEGAPVTITITSDTAETYTITTAPVAGGTAGAVSGTDYTALTPSPKTLTFATAGTTQTITINTIDDNVYEGPEQFSVTATGDTTNTVGVSTTVTILDNDNPPTYTMTADKTTVVEGTDTLVTVTVTLIAPSEQAVSIPIATYDGTAKSPGDYTAYTGPLTLSSLQTSKQFTIPIVNDTVDEDDQTFQIRADAGTNVTGVAAPITITIVDNDLPPTVTIANPASPSTEGSDVSFPVTISPASEKTVTVKYDTSDLTAGQLLTSTDGLATAGKDYTAVSGGTVTFAPGDPTTKAAVVHTTVDDLDEISPEEFRATLSAPTNATLGNTTTAIGKIADPGTVTVPTVALSPTSVTEGSNGLFNPQTFTVTLSKASGRTQIVHWAATLGAGTAAATDFNAASGDVTFAPGDLSKSFTVDVMGDKTHEGNKTFTITLSPGAEGSLVNLAGDLKANLVTITDDDALPTFTVNDVSMPEGNSASVVLYTVHLSNPTSAPVTFTATDQPDTAKSNPTGNPSTAFGTDDYSLAATPISIPAGQTNGYAFVLVNGDSIYESDESASIKFTTASTDVSGTTVIGQLMLKNDDVAPTLSVVSATAKEGDSVAVKGLVAGQSQAKVTFNITYTGKAVGGSKAASASDFVNPGAQVVDLLPGTLVGSSLDLGTVKVNTNTTADPARTIAVEGTGVGDVGTVKPGAITIAADSGSTPTPGTPTINVPTGVVGASVVRVAGTAAAGSTVELWGAPTSPANPALTMLQSMTASDAGVYSFERWIGQGYRFGIKVGDYVSPEMSVKVTQKPVFVASSTTAGVASFAVQGNPRAAGQTVVVQRYLSGKWVKIAQGVTGSTNQWRGTVKIASGTSVATRAFVVGDTTIGIYGGYSDIKRFTIK
ncbi:hypothetical protein ODJ79_17325 [Actinoplanes sp. KI2]|uniref:Calx-beta domain-containing protein n=1 Tax=Actinoplanes sp. KI2 TaxID=2983315 RepID=UPI0021D5FFAF|nr:Calx-beta domain-containing protein [Actinoplanes sp. KI2]MCU7725491.1 hypothetical protein [Actinoplanes sp. KI2]